MQWLLNISAPHLGVPIALFAATSGLGLAPYNVVTVRAGAVLASLGPGASGEGTGQPPSPSVADLLTPATVATLCAAAALVALPALCAQRCERAMLAAAVAPDPQSEPESEDDETDNDADKKGDDGRPAHKNKKKPAASPAAP